MKDLTKYIRDIPDFPKPGIVFKDSTPLLADAGALSLRITYVRGGGEGLYHLGAIEPAPPTAREGSVRAARGIHLGDHEVGWGLFASRYTDADGVTHGDETFVPGYEVAFHFDVGDARVDVSVFFLVR